MPLTFLLLLLSYNHRNWSGDARKTCETLLSKLDPANPLFAALKAQLP